MSQYDFAKQVAIIALKLVSIFFARCPREICID